MKEKTTKEQRQKVNSYIYELAKRKNKQKLIVGIRGRENT